MVQEWSEEYRLLWISYLLASRFSFFFFSKCQNQVRQTSVTGELSPAFFISSPSELLSSALWQVL